MTLGHLGWKRQSPGGVNSDNPAPGMPLNEPRVSNEGILAGSVEWWRTSRIKSSRKPVMVPAE